MKENNNKIKKDKFVISMNKNVFKTKQEQSFVNKAVFNRYNTQIIEYAYVFHTIIIVYLLCLLCTFNIFVGISHVHGESMRPTINDTKNISQVVYYDSGAKFDIGDIVLVSRQNDTPIIKRVIAMPGDVVNMCYDNQTGSFDIYVNHIKINEPYTIQSDGSQGNQYTYNAFCIYKNQFPQNVDSQGNIHLKDDQVYVLGDNRANSTDSSLLGPMQIENVIGTVFAIIPYNHNEMFNLIYQIFFQFN